MNTPLTIDWNRFAGALKAERTLNSDSVRDAAESLGISAATLCRAELGREISAENYLTLCVWLQRYPLDFAKRASFTGNKRKMSRRNKAKAT